MATSQRRAANASTNTVAAQPAIIARRITDIDLPPNALEAHRAANAQSAVAVRCSAGVRRSHRLLQRRSDSATDRVLQQKTKGCVHSRIVDVEGGNELYKLNWV